MQCLCGETARKSYVERTVTRDNGRKVTFTDVPAEVCPACGELYFTPEVSGMMLRLREISALETIPFPSSRPLSAKGVHKIRKDLNLSQARLGSLLGLSTTAVALWEQGRRRPDGPSRVLLRLMAVLSATVEPLPGTGRKKRGATV